MKSERILLPNGCSCSKPSVFPKNWKTCDKSALKLYWRIQYYFYDPNFPKPTTPIVVKGMNEYKSLADRRAVTQMLIDDELDALLNKGYNPYLKKYTTIEEEKSTSELNSDLPIIDAFRIALGKLEGTKEHLDQVRFALNRFEKGAAELNLCNVKIYDLKRSQFRMILEHLKLTDNYFNKFKSYFSSLFKILIGWECCEVNLTRDIEKKSTVKNIREVLSFGDVEKILEALRPQHPDFYRYGKIFLYSGGRSRELFNIQAKNVRIDLQEYDVLIKKGKQYVWETKVIIKNAIPFWKEIMSMAKSPEDFLFSEGLVPGANSISSRQITIRWRKHVKGKLVFYNDEVRLKSELDLFGLKRYQAITADFYSMKHSFLDLLDEVSTETAQQMAAHRSDKITKVYAVGNQKRKNERLKKLSV